MAGPGAPSGPEGQDDPQVVAPQLLWYATVAVSLLAVLLLAVGLPGRYGLPVVALVVSSPTPVPTPSVGATPTARPALVVLPTPSSTPTITPTAAPQRYKIGNTGGDGAAVRQTPSKTGTLLAGWPDNTILVEAGPDVTGDGVTWKKVRDPRGNVGYAQAQYLLPVPPGG